MIGFLPVMSYFNTKKDIKNGTKCPVDQEDLIRAIILKETLEKIGCDSSNLEIKVSKQKVQPEQQEDIFAKIDKLTETSIKQDADKPLIILDAQNIAMKHGKDKVFSVKGIYLAINYWKKNGHQVVCFVPDYLVDYE